MKSFLHSRDGASKGAALMIALALLVLLTGLALAYFSRTTTDRQLAESSYNATSADLLARSALDIVVSDFKQEILAHPTVTPAAPFYITPVPYGTPGAGQTPIPNLIRRSFSGDPTGRTSSVNSGTASANGRSIGLARWNRHYLIPRANSSDTSIDSSPVSSFIAPDWVLVTGQGPSVTPAPSAVIGRYAFAVYDEGGLLDMTVAGYPGWSNSCSPTPPAGTPSPTPWLVNVGRKGTVGFADLSVLPWPSASPSAQSRIDNIVGWRNYAMTQRPNPQFGNFNFPLDTDTCTKQDFYGSYLMYFGDPPFIIDSLADKLNASLYPFTGVATQSDPSNTRTDQALATRQQLLKLMLSLGSSSAGYNQNVLQYMGTFSRERNWPAPDWPGLNGALSAGRYNLNNLGLVVPNPADCNLAHGRKVGWQTGKNKNHLCGNSLQVNELFGLFWVKAEVVQCPAGQFKCPGNWRYIGNVSSLPDPNATPTPKPGIDCLRRANRQNDFFQVLNFALFGNQCGLGEGDANLAKTFGVGASLIDQYDSGADCIAYPPNSWANTGCDLDSHVVTNNGGNEGYATHTTVIDYGRGNGNKTTAYGMEPNYSTVVSSDGNTNGDCAPGDSSHGCNNAPHRPSPAPGPTANTQVISHGFSTVGEFGYGIDTSSAGLPTLNFSPPNFSDAPVLDFFSYNPISSAYPRAGIVNLYTRNAPVLAAIISQTLQTNAAANVSPPTPVVSASQAMTAANAIVTETQAVLSGSGTWPVTRTDLTRAIAARLAEKGGGVIGATWTNEQKQSIARALAEMGQTRTWNLLIDVIAQTGKYKPNSPDLSGSNFVVEGEKRYWLHIGLGRDLIHADGSPCLPSDTGCQVDVLGTQLEEVIE